MSQQGGSPSDLDDPPVEEYDTEGEGVGPFEVPPLQPEAPKDKVRKSIAYALLVMLAGDLVLAWLAAFSGHATWAEAKDFIVETVPPLVALVGAATGFYFGTKSD